jgi:hypothetical protein
MLRNPLIAAARKPTSSGRGELELRGASHKSFSLKSPAPKIMGTARRKE